MKIALKLIDSSRRNKRGWHASSNIRGHWLARYWDELDDVFHHDHFKMEYNHFCKLETQLELLKDYNVVIFHKLYDYRLAGALHALDKKIIIDMTDPDYLVGWSGISRAGMCLMLMSQANAIVVNTEALKNEIQKGTNKPIYVIPDRLDLNDYKGKKVRNDNEVKSLVYYGHSDNHSRLDKYDFSKYNLTVISDKPYKNFRFVEWTPDIQRVNAEIVKHDAVFIGVDDKLKEFRSDNRIKTAKALNMPFTTDLIHWDFSQTYDLFDLDIRKSVNQYKEVINDIYR